MHILSSSCFCQTELVIQQNRLSLEHGTAPNRWPHVLHASRRFSVWHLNSGEKMQPYICDYDQNGVTFQTLVNYLFFLSFLFFLVKMHIDISLFLHT